MDIYIKEIFQSISGEIGDVPQGTIMTFIRVAGCDLRCAYCDTRDSWGSSESQKMTVEEVVSRVLDLGCFDVLITGGEPLLQYSAFSYLCDRLFDLGFRVSVETNGTRKVLPLVSVRCWIVDFKLPSAGEYEHSQMNLANFEYLSFWDVVKFVVQDKNDFTVALDVCEALQAQRNYTGHPRIAMSPVYGKLDPKELFSWIVEVGQFHIILNLQIHKVFGFA